MHFMGGDVNLNRYCGGRPTSLTDASGLYLWWTDPRVNITIEWTDAKGNRHQESGEGAALLTAALSKISTAGGLITTMVLKGHGAIDGSGFPGILEVDGERDVVRTTAGIYSDGLVHEIDITKQLKAVTNEKTTIRLNGCFTNQAAKELAQLLNNGALVEGNVGPSLSVPLTMEDIGWGFGY